MRPQKALQLGKDDVMGALGGGCPLCVWALRLGQVDECIVDQAVANDESPLCLVWTVAQHVFTSATLSWNPLAARGTIGVLEWSPLGKQQMGFQNFGYHHRGTPYWFGEARLT